MSSLYNSDFTVPMPTLRVGCYPCEGFEGISDIEAIVDTGADGTIVPATLLQSIGVKPSHGARMRSHWGEWRFVKIGVIDMALDGILLPAVEVVADEKSDIILLGRNVLNRLILLLDGPGRQMDILTRRPRRL